MLLKLIFVIAVTQALVSAAPKKKAAEEHVAALFVKDADNGELRFLTGTSGFNQLITQKQDLLEQLRPTNGANNINPIIIDLNTAGIETTSPTVGFGGGNGNGGGLGAVAANASPIADLLPQIAGQVVAGGDNSPTTGTSLVTSPVVSRDQGTGNTGPAPGRRVIRRRNKQRQGNRNSNKRRRNRRRPAKRNQQNRKVILLRPQRS